MLSFPSRWAATWDITLFLQTTTVLEVDEYSSGRCVPCPASPAHVTCCIYACQNTPAYAVRLTGAEDWHRAVQHLAPEGRRGRLAVAGLCKDLHSTAHQRDGRCAAAKNNLPKLRAGLPHPSLSVTNPPAARPNACWGPSHKVRSARFPSLHPSPSRVMTANLQENRCE